VRAWGELRVNRLLRACGGRPPVDLTRYAGRPADYAREHLGATLTPQQREVFERLEQPPYRVLVRSANTQGKTFLAAAYANYFFDCFPPSITLCTAPTWASVRDLLFKEIRTLRRDQRWFAPKDTRLQRSWNHYIHGYTAINPDAFQGRHAERLLLIFDEATGVDREFWLRGETMFESSGHHRWLCLYNPNDPSSYARLAEESGGWSVVSLSALDHPNVLAESRGEPPPVPAAVRLETVARRVASECEAGDPADPLAFEFPPGSGQWHRPRTPEFEAQVLGRWPSQAAAAVWTPAVFDRCLTPRPVPPDAAVVIGCDVARFGDDSTAIAARRGPALVLLERHRGLDSRQVADRLKQIAAILVGDSAAYAVPVFIDETGGYGAGVLDQANGYRFLGVSAAAGSPDPRFAQLRSSLVFGLRAMADAGVLDFSRIEPRLRDDLRAELLAHRYSLDSAGRRQVERKTTIKSRIGRSPDLADAVALCYYIDGIDV
jgi:hypothetical protein